MQFPDGSGFYPDQQDGVAGYNTDPARGADTFHPFSITQIKKLNVTTPNGKTQYNLFLDADGRKNLSFSISLIQGVSEAWVRIWVHLPDGTRDLLQHITKLGKYTIDTSNYTQVELEALCDGTGYSNWGTITVEDIIIL